MGITAVLDKKTLGERRGFHFDTNVMECAEVFMTRINVSYEDYMLFFDGSVPDGIYTHVVTSPVFRQGTVIDWKFML